MMVMMIVTVLKVMGSVIFADDNDEQMANTKIISLNGKP